MSDIGVGVTTGVEIPFLWERRGAGVQVYPVGELPETATFTTTVTYEVS